MRSFIFVFLGVTEDGADADINILQSRLEEVLGAHTPKVEFNLKGDILTLTLSKPDFQFYISFEKNGSESLPHWSDLAKNFELPWDINPVDKYRLMNIYSRLESKGWTEYNAFHQLGFIILEEMEKFTKVKVFTIPSMGKRTLWDRILGSG